MGDLAGSELNPNHPTPDEADYADPDDSGFWPALLVGAVPCGAVLLMVLLAILKGVVRWT